MPRRKKSGQSPARVPGGSLDHTAGYRLLPQGSDGSAMANNFSSSSGSLSSSDKETVVKNMQEVFSHLDPEVIYIVLSECDFKVENAMDSLLELSVAAEVAAPIPPPVSGFERTAAALLSPQHFSERRPDPDSSRPAQPSSPSSTNLLTEEMDLLVDQELETLTTQTDAQEQHRSNQYLSTSAPLSSFPPPPFPKQPLPELLQPSVRPRSEQAGSAGRLVDFKSGASSPLDQLSSWEDETSEGRQPAVLSTETPADKLKPPLDLAASGRPSAFQVYKKKDPSSHSLSDGAGVVTAAATAGGARSRESTNREPLGYMSSAWNLEAPTFAPRFLGNQGPTFITPVAQTPSNWPSLPRHTSTWMGHAPVCQPPLKPSATVPKSWTQPAAPQFPARGTRLRLEGRVLVLLRGAPGSGKSTLARALLEHNSGGVILSTDDYFKRHGGYHFDPNSLGEAHDWNHKRAKEAFDRGSNPIIIDNTNMQGWEMKPYVAQALKHGYKVLFREPDTWWKNKPRELEKRTTHDVPGERIRRMLNNYERFVTVQSIMGSQMPERKQHLLLENRSSQLIASETPCPDLVEQFGVTEESKKSRPQLFSSLPDVSSIGRSNQDGKLEEGTKKSTESLNFLPTDRPMETRAEISDEDDDMDLGDLDSELDAQLQQNQSEGDQRIPDCIVESVMSEDHHGDELPVAFCESIGQRVKRERPSRRSGFDRMEPADLVKDANQSESEAKEKERTNEEEAPGLEDQEERETPKMLDFVGDWPSEGSLQQRQVRRRERHEEGNGQKGEGLSKDVDETKIAVTSGPDVTDFQKVLDLIQMVEGAIQTGSSRSSSPSLSSGEQLREEDETGSRFEECCEETEQNMKRVNNSRGELPDCVLDWKAADSCRDRESNIDKEGDLQPEKETSSTNPPPAVSDDSLCISKAALGSHRIDGEVSTEFGDSDTKSCTEDGEETRTEADGSHVSEECQSPMFEGSVEGEAGALSAGSQERKQRRRSGKQCKLALTFTQPCPDSSLNTLDSPSATAESTDIEPSCNPDRGSSLDLKPNADLLIDFESDAHLQPPPPSPLPSPSPPPSINTCLSTQTEPQDFALLWRLSRQDSDTVITGCSHSSDFTVLYGDSSRFVPELSSAVSAAVAVHPSGYKEVPYRVVHEKGTQVEERELGETQDRLESLCILSRHFKLVNFDTLEDLYDKCNQDLEWTTNLLLDSGERFFKDEDGEENEEEEEKDEDGAGGEDDQKSSGSVVETTSCPDVLDESHSEDPPKGWSAETEETQQSTSGTAGESNESTSDTDVPGPEGVADRNRNKDQPDTASHSEEGRENTKCREKTEDDLGGGAWGGSLDDGVIIEELRTEVEDDIASMDEIHRLVQAELRELEREEEQRKKKKRSSHLDIQSVELKLPTEVALQLTELFGPVGVDPGTCSSDDHAVQMDLNLAKLLHQKWKETIQERQRQAALSFHLLQESSSHWGDVQANKPGPQERTPPHFLISADGYASVDSQSEGRGQFPFMDHWNVSRPHVSLRDIIKEEQALQANVEKTRQSRVDLDRRDGATLLKEKQLFSLFPTIDQHFLQDIFRDHNYCLTETELFLRSLLDEGPVKTVVAPEAPRSEHHRAASKEREKRQKALESTKIDYQDVEDPEYDDFRAEASLQRSRQLESFSKAAEAYKQGRKEVASFYAQQGHMHGLRMREANHRAAVQIFERVNKSLLPQNILDLHGLHVDEALEHLAQVLQDKTAECEQGLCRPQLSVITGRGNHSQGGVARIRPAVLDYLSNKHYRFTEPKPGLVLVSLK